MKKTLSICVMTCCALGMLSAADWSEAAQKKKNRRTSASKTVKTIKTVAPVVAVGTATGVVTVKSADRIMAVVNKNVITERGLNARVQQVLANLKRQNVASPPLDELRAQVLERMILEESLLQHADAIGLRIDDVELEAMLDQLAANNQLTPAAFRQKLASQGIPLADFREEIRRELVIQQLREREVDRKITVSESEIDAWLSRSEAASQQEYRLAHILIQVRQNASVAQVEQRAQRAQEALQRLQQGMNFSEVAAVYSDAPDGLSGGELGWRTPSRLPPLFVEQLAHMQRGEVSPILRSASGFHILKVLDTRTSHSEAESSKVEQRHARHILIKVGEHLSQAEARQRIDEIAAQLAAGLSFEEAARRFSEDGSATRGGDLGWISPGDTVPEFERALYALETGKVSAPVRSPFGWHLIELLATQQHQNARQLNRERQRAQVRQELSARKAEQRYQEWQDQIRDSTYVENHLYEDREH